MMNPQIDNVSYSLDDEGEALQYFLLLFSRQPSAMDSALIAIKSIYSTLRKDLELAQQAHIEAQRCLSDAISYAVEPAIKSNNAVLSEIEKRYLDYVGESYPLTDSEEKYKALLKKK